MDGSCEACGSSVPSEDDKEAVVRGGDDSNDDGARSGAATGIGAKLRSSTFDSRSPELCERPSHLLHTRCVPHTMIMSIRSLLMADMSELPSPAALPDGDNPNGESAEAKDNVCEYFRQE